MGPIAFVFPGQASQFVGMGKDLRDNFREAREVFEEANDVLRMNLSSLCFDGPEAALNLTHNTQPSVLTVSVAALRVVATRVGIAPDYLAGHSLGEYSAIIAAQGMQFQDGVTTVKKRGQFMQEAVPEGEGGMAAILGLSREKVQEVCQATAQSQVITPANFNCPGQIVISGHTEALNRAIKLAADMGAKRCVILPVSAPFHCELMIPAGEKLRRHLEGVVFTALEHPIITNVEARENQDAERANALLIKQVSHPVLWEDSVKALLDKGVDTFVEVGPGKVLSGLVRKIDRSATVVNVEDTKSLMDFEKTIKERA